jgi:hypothetical protein
MHPDHVLALRLAPGLVLPRDLPPAPQASYIETSSSHRYSTHLGGFQGVESLFFIISM